MLPVIAFPMIDPIAVQIGPLAIRWYALAYIAGIVLCWRIVRRVAEAAPTVGTPRQTDDFVTWATLGIILGGRLGYVLLYRPDHYLFAPWEIPMIWQGGMAFHGGALGVIIAALWFTRTQNINPLAFGDRVAVGVPIGLLLGRLANFINAELYGRPSTVPWAMVFPTDPLQLPRHPSQLYQAFLEGALLLGVMLFLAGRPALRARVGFLTGALIAGMGGARIIGEFFREPDAHLVNLTGIITIGQLFSLPMLAAGIWLMRRARAA